MMVSASRSSGPACVCLGRLGDVTAAIPIAHQLHYETGARTPFIVSREYAPILDACSYIEPVIVDTPFHELNRVIRKQQSRYSKLHVAQTYSSDGRFEEPTTDSFVTEAWNRAEMLPKFGLPLVFDRRDAKREQELLNDLQLVGGPVLVVHRGGVSSPYNVKNELLAKFVDFPSRILDITDLKASQPQDLLAVLENASVAILADSFPLHLSFACRDLPVIALQTDKPTNWFGAPPRPNWIANHRYGESVSKFEGIAEIARKEVEKPKCSYFQFPPGAYNASVLGDLTTWRVHPNGSWVTRLTGLKEGSKPKAIVLSKEHDACSWEDARLFEHNGKPHIAYTVSKLENKRPFCIVEYGELKIAKDCWRVINPKRVKYGRNDFTSMEKNWVFWSQAPYLYCLYASEPEQIVLEIDGDRVVREHRSPAPKWEFGQIRGDVILPYHGRLLRIFHSCERYASKKFRYFIGHAFLEAEPPFKTITVSPVPLFAGDDSRPKTAHHSKQSVVFSCGASRDGDSILLPISRDDDTTEIVRITPKQLGL